MRRLDGILALLLLIVSGYFLGKIILGSTITFDTDEADHANAAIELYECFGAGCVLEAITRQAFYPPIHSFFVAAHYALLGPTLFSSRLPSLVLMLAAALMLGVAAKRVGGSSATAIALIVTSPLVLENSVLSMLETCGIFFFAAVILHFTATKRSVEYLAILLLLLTLTKYSFGILIAPAIFLVLCIEHKKGAVTKIQIATFAIIVMLGLGGWLLVTEWRSALHFIIGHPSNAPLLSRENLLYEVMAWLNSFTVHLWLGVGTILAVSSSCFKKDRPTAHSFALISILTSFFILALSSTNEQRHIILAVPAMAFIIALLPKVNYIITAAVIALALLNFDVLQARIHRAFEGDRAFLVLHEKIAAATPEAQPILVYGHSDAFALEAMRWHKSVYEKTRYTAVQIDGYPYRADKNRTAKKRSRNLEKGATDPTFPIADFNLMQATGYYKAIVRLENITQSKRFKKQHDAADAALSTSLYTTVQSGRYVARVYVQQ